jgi:hypothetical protein
MFSPPGQFVLENAELSQAGCLKRRIWVKLLLTDPETRLAACWVCALVGPFPVLRLYLWLNHELSHGQITDATVFGVTVAVVLCVLAGLACVAAMPIRIWFRIIIAFLYAPSMWFALEVFGFFIGMIAYNEVP